MYYAPRSFNDFVELIRRKFSEAIAEGDVPLFCSIDSKSGKSIPILLHEMFPAGPVVPPVETAPDPNAETTEENYDSDETVRDDKETTPTEDAILHVLAETDKPLKAVTIAHRAGQELTDNFRKTIYRMVRDKSIIATSDNRYWHGKRKLPCE